MDHKCTAIVLSAGKGKRMGSDIPKQYLLLDGKPVLYYCLKSFQDSFIDDIVIVASEADFLFIREEIVDKYDITKVKSIVPGGAERYDSVLCGLRAADGCDYVFVHDGARPFADEEILKRAYETVEKYGTAIVSMPVKDTIKVVDDNGFTVDTPDRSHVWLMQTPQVFGYREILEAYERMDSYMKKNANDSSNLNITDDAMVMEHFGSLQVHVSEGSYRNIKITTPEDMIVAQALLKQGI
ncbi:MAG: 2-C-methyl-D-erythritol 4-phosphate cytidylyltransferase [Lachnospiraceae bacterium]|nr:2-C-methyl-D-erythritol 4-phosphate cytidylyltransferase [Lachnospiraceae bacterium]